MEYMLDNEGYIMHVLFGCSNDSSIVYAGELPAGYESFTDWAENENINAWKIVEGNLAKDASKEQELIEQYAIDEANNSHITQSQLIEAMANSTLTDEEISFIVSNAEALSQMLPLKTVEGKIVQFNNASGDTVQAIELTTSTNITDNVKLIFNNRNLFKNTAASKTENGINWRVNADKSITVNGTTTEGSQLTIAGSAENTVPIFVFMPNTYYYLESLPEGIVVNLYENDGTGTGLTQVYSGSGGTTLRYANLQNVTYAVLQISANVEILTEASDNITTETGDLLMTDGRSSFSNETARLMLSVGHSSVDYMKYREQSILIPLGNNTFETTDTLKIDSYGNVSLVKTNSTVQLETVTMPNTYADYNTVYATKDVRNIRLTYKKASFDYETATANVILELNDTPDGTGFIHKLTWAGMAAGRTHNIHVYAGASGDSRYNNYTLDLTGYTGTVDVTILDGQVQVFQNGSQIGTLSDPIYLETYSPQTKMYLSDLDYPMTCEYMTESDFTVFCTRQEKNASIKVLEDSISLIVENGEVTPASIIAAINDNESSVKISADNIDIAGTTFPTIRNTAGTCVVNTLAQQGIEPAIAYTAPWHNFSGGDVYIDKGIYVDEDAKIGKLSNGYLMYVEPEENKVTIANGSLEIELNLFADGVVGLGTKGNYYALRIDADGDIRIRGDVQIDGDLTVNGTINN